MYFPLDQPAENYNEAVELLKQRYGNTQALINAHIQVFVSLPVKKSVIDVKGLGKLNEKAENSVRNSKALEVDSSSYGNLPVSLINAKLPNELRILNEVWLLSDLLKHLKIEIEAKERSISLGHFNTEGLKIIVTINLQCPSL